VASKGHARRAGHDGEVKKPMETVTVATLREWLAEHKPVTVLDVRAQEDRDQWSIPESVHVDAYEALKQGRSDVLIGVVKPARGPVITVCNRGKVGQIAAEQLRRRGVEAISLAGGMQAWSLAWNIAEVPLANTGAQVLQVRRTGKGVSRMSLGRLARQR